MTDNIQVRDRRSKGWYWIEGEIIDEFGSALGAFGIAVYNVLAHFADKEESAYPSVSTIANILNCSDSQVRRELRKMRDLNLLSTETRTTEEGRQTSNLYNLLSARDAAKSGVLPYQVDRVGVSGRQGEGVTQTGAGLSTGQGEGVYLTPEQELINKSQMNQSQVINESSSDLIIDAPNGAADDDSPELIMGFEIPKTYRKSNPFEVWLAERPGDQLTEIKSAYLWDWIDQWGERVVIVAICKASLNNARNTINYMQSIFEGWSASGLSAASAAAPVDQRYAGWE